MCHRSTADFALGTSYDVKILRVPTSKNGLDDLIPCQWSEATFDWPIRATTHDQKHFAFRSEFRPLDILQLVYFTCLTSVQRKHCPHWLGVFGCGLCFLLWRWVLGFCWCFGVGVFGLLSPINMQCFLSFY